MLSAGAICTVCKALVSRHLGTPCSRGSECTGCPSAVQGVNSHLYLHTKLQVFSPWSLMAGGQQGGSCSRQGHQPGRAAWRAEGPAAGRAPGTEVHGRADDACCPEGAPSEAGRGSQGLHLLHLLRGPLDLPHFVCGVLVGPHLPVAEQACLMTWPCQPELPGLQASPDAWNATRGMGGDGAASS